MWCFVFLLCLPAMSSAEIGSNMNKISRHLMIEMSDVMELASVNYSTPVINTTYVASVQFDMRAMGPLYNSTHMVIDIIANKEAYPEGIVSVSDGHINVASPRENWRVLLAHYAGPTAVVVVAVLLIAILPLAGLFWCCCYWCRVGRRRRPFDRKYDACLKGLLAIILIGLLTLFLFGVVCAFATDSQVESGIAEASDSLRASTKDVQEYLNATQAHAHWLLVVNYKELSDTLNAVLYTSGLTVSMKLGEYSRAVSVTTLNTMVQQLDEVQADLRTVQRLTADLRLKADELNTGLRKVKSQLQTLMQCQQPECLALQDKNKIAQLDTEIRYSQMPDVSELLSNVTSLLDGRIKEEVAAGQQVFRDIQVGIRRSVDEHIPSVQAAIAETGRRLEALARSVSWRAGNASRAAGEAGAAQAEAVRELHARYGPYRRYAGAGCAAALLAVTCALVWGLTCGVCGKRPDPYGASECCNKGAGSRCLLCGVALAFAAAAAAAAVLLLYFLAGVAAQRFICDPLTEPRNNRLFSDLDKFIELEKYMFNERSHPEFNLTSVLVDCHSNRTIYETLQLRRLYDLEGVRAEVVAQVARRVEALRPQYPAPGERLTILRPAARDKLLQLANTGLSDFDFERILDALETNMTSLALDSLAHQLNGTARALPQPLQRDMLAATATLQRLQRHTLRPMQEHTATLNQTAIKLRDEIRFNHSSLKEAITYLMHETTEAEQFLNTQGPERLQNLTRELARVMQAQLERYLARVLVAAQEELGPCAPLSNALNATRDAACRKILMPTNGYWISVAWCIILFVPIMVVAQRLARLYLHVDPYPGPLVEAAYKAEKRTGRGEGRQRSRDLDSSRGSGPYGGSGAGAGAGGAGGTGPGPREGSVATAVDAHHARRYNDMAPKHWEEGPPRYHGPTEYERPPPYYYPGPNDRQ